jgi:uncharacterized membrane protein SirB2
MARQAWPPADGRGPAVTAGQHRHADQNGENGSVLRTLALITIVVGLVALTAAACVLSYGSVHAFAAQAGVSRSLARIYPVICDAMLVVAGCSVLALRGAGLISKVYAWLCFIVLLAALAASEVVREAGIHVPSRQAEVTAAVIPWALVLVAFGLLLALLRHARRRRPSHRAGQPVPAENPPQLAPQPAVLQPAVLQPADPPPGASLPGASVPGASVPGASVPGALGMTGTGMVAIGPAARATAETPDPAPGQADARPGPDRRDPITQSTGWPATQTTYPGDQHTGWPGAAVPGTEFRDATAPATARSDAFAAGPPTASVSVPFQRPGDSPDTPPRAIARPAEMQLRASTQRHATPVQATPAQPTPVQANPAQPTPAQPTPAQAAGSAGAPEPGQAHPPVMPVGGVSGGSYGGDTVPRGELNAAPTSGQASDSDSDSDSEPNLAAAPPKLDRPRSSPTPPAE